MADVLRWRAQHQPEETAYIFLQHGEAADLRLSYAELDQRAQMIAAMLQARVPAGARALLMFPPGLDYIAAFFGCLYAAVTAVPVYPPHPNKREQSLLRLRAIVNDAQIQIALTTAEIGAMLEHVFAHDPDFRGVHCQATDVLDLGGAADWRDPRVSPDTLAFLQYTSGSTSTPKGVMVGHGNLLYNLRMLQSAWQHPPDRPYVSWLPLFHDMGLISQALEAMYVGAPCVLMASVAFVQQPVRWLQAISQYRAHTSGAPNFAYDLCVRKITPEQREQLDLSEWRLAFSGAEPVRAETLEAFATTFAPCGFRRDALYPCYGLAEATVFVAGGTKTAAPIVKTFAGAALEQHQVRELSADADAAHALVACGYSWLDQKIVIVDPETSRPSPPDRIGEIWVSGPHVAQGYWQRPEETERVFRARIDGGDDSPFMRTGDLGFFQDGELYITGRLKDLVIIRGRNHYPQDIELTVEQSHWALRKAFGAAFSVEVGGEEQLVVVQEIERQHRKANLEEITRAIRQALAEQHDLQAYAVVLLRPGSIPKTSSGKIQRRACRARFLAGELEVIGQSIQGQEPQLPQPAAAAEAPAPARTAEADTQRAEIEGWLVAQVAARTGLPAQAVGVHAPFASFGLDSATVVSLAGDLEARLGRPLAPTLLYDYPSIALLTGYLTGAPTPADTRSQPGRSAAPEEAVAIVGLGCRTPGASSPEEFWSLLSGGGDAVTGVPESRWSSSQLYSPGEVAPGKTSTRWGGFLADIDQFSPQFFNISPREAEQMDPQQRLLLEVTWEALEHAGLRPERLAGSRAGVFIGISNNDYARLQFGQADQIDAYAGTGSALSIAANRISYFLNLQGPSMAVDTACSSSLVAVHLACQSLRSGESDLALAGGVNLILTPELTIAFSQARMMSPEGRCKTFDAAADGYVRGEGCGVVVLKRLSDALRDNDPVLAVVHGSAVNQDGASNGLTAPNGLAQQAVIRAALDSARVAPAQIGYVETHGTGTPLGDPIEVQALGAVLREGRPADQPCVIGSVKTNIGHLEAAAGIVGLIKVVLSLRHGAIPPHKHFQSINPHIRLGELALKIPDAQLPWPAGGRPRLAGVSSFGFGGTNAHVVVGEAPARAPAANPVDRPLHILTLAARSPEALAALAASYGRRLGAGEGSLADVCYTANTGRARFAHRLALVAGSDEQAAALLQAAARGEAPAGTFSGAAQRQQRPKLALLFTGQGARMAGMGRDLYETQPTFRRLIDRCADILRPSFDLLEALSSASGSALDDTAYAQPALFAFEYALAELYRSWGIVPDAVLGHSVGEYVAACVAGVFSLEDGLRLVAERGRLMQELPGEGRMAAVLTDLDTVTAALRPFQDRVSIAAVNGPNNIVVAGEQAAVQELVRAVEAQGVSTRSLPVARAFHSPQLDPMLEQLERRAGLVPMQAPRIPLVSNLTGRLFEAGQAPDARYWRRHARETVLFASGLQTLVEQGFEVFLEVGPDQVLSRLGRRTFASEPVAWLAAQHQRQSGWQALLTSLAQLYTQGVPIDWDAFDADYHRARVALPTYPFERQRYWITPAKNGRAGAQVHADHGAPEHHEGARTDADTGAIAMAASPRAAAPAAAAPTRALARLREIIEPLLHMPAGTLDADQLFLEIGADSLVLVEVTRTIRDTFGVALSIRQIFEETPTLRALADYVARALPELAAAEEAPPAAPEPAAPAAQVPPAEAVAPSPAPAPTAPQLPQPAAAPAQHPALAANGFSDVLAQQLQVLSQVMSQQIALLNSSIGASAGGHAPAAGSGSQQNGHAPHAGNGHVSPPASNGRTAAPPTSNGSGFAVVAGPKAPAEAAPSAPAVFTPYRSIEPERGAPLTPRQRQHLDQLVERYTRRTAGSRGWKERHGSHLADYRNSVGFKQDTKDLLYPIVAQRAEGARFWDIDGNEYIDMCLGFGVHMFGHQAPFISRALEEVSRQGVLLGPQWHIAGETAELICEATGQERVTFTTSGTEALMGAIRIARASTGRRKVAMFAGAYHGWSDGLLAKHELADGQVRSAPSAPGIPEGMVADVLVLTYNSPESLKIIREHGHELAAVVVEPVQSRRPDLQPREFLRELRTITAETGAALIFDEVITGFRVHPGGAQAHFGVQADMATYGKVLGGGLPIGVIAGKARFMSASDGGVWSFGDASYPQAQTTFVVGTFSKHPMALAAARAVLQHLKEAGPALQQQLNRRTARLAGTLNEYFQRTDVPMRIEHFGSLFRFVTWGNLDLLYYHLLNRGVYTWEGHTCYLSTAHTDADVDQIIRVFIDSVEELREGGFLPPAPGGSGGGLRVPAAPPVSRAPAPAASLPTASVVSQQPAKAALQFSLYFFGKYDAAFDTDKYRLLVESARFADQHGFSSIWLPERHFHSFGGLSPSPAVLAAALARETQRIRLCAGSVVLPLHHPIQVAEEWAMVDNLSRGRIGLSVASGWHPNDFVFAPEAYENRREIMYRGIEMLRKLWRGEAVEVPGGKSPVQARLFPMPAQRELPLWVTVSKTLETYRQAGALGAGVLTNMMEQSVEDLARNIALYRQTLAEHGHDPAAGRVTVLLHTYIGDDLERVRREAHEPFCEYLRNFLTLTQQLLRNQGIADDRVVNINDLSKADLDDLLTVAYRQYVRDSALVGTPETCVPILDRLAEIGVDEVACFVDFGVDPAAALEGLKHLDALRERYARPAARSAGAPALPAPAERRLPLSESQQHFWLFNQLGEAASIATNETVALHLRGPLDLEALRRAFQQVIDRHEALRITFDSAGAYQRVAAELRVELGCTDFSSLDPAERERAVEQWQLQNSRLAFDLVRGPLLRGHVLRLGAHEHLLVLTMCHLVIDGWSLGVIVREIDALYSAALRGAAADLGEPAQFSSYIRQREAQLHSPERAASEAFWLRQFPDIPVLDLPSDRPRPALKTYAGAKEHLRLDKPLVDALKSVSGRNGSTLFMTLLTGFAVLLRRLSGQSDFVIGIPTAGRAASHSETMVGYAINLLPVRLRTQDQASFAQQLAATRGTLADLYEHMDYPFGTLIQKLSAARDASRSPLISVLFNLDRPVALPQMGELAVDLVEHPVSFVQFDFYLNAIEFKDELRIDFLYNSDLFDAETIRRWKQHFTAILGQIVADSQAPVARLSLLDGQERRRILEDWNDTATDFPRDRGVHELFAEQAARTPGAVAVVQGRQQITYAQLDERADRLARRLRALGVGPDVAVGLYLDRSPDLIVAMLATLKAGGIYVPLDRSYPLSRLRLMVQDAGVGVLLTSSALREPLAELTDGLPVRSEALDQDGGRAAGEAGADLPRSVSPEQGAYIMYTSGSTGTPKGILIPHRAIVRLVRDTDYIQLRPEDRVALVSNVSFDAATFEIWGPLLNGAAVVDIDKDIALSSHGFARELQAQGITTLFLTTALFNRIAADVPEAFGGLKQVLFGGEAVDHRSVRAVLASRPPQRLLHVYGPTESTTFATWYHIMDISEAATNVPIGYPLANTTVYVLDEHMQPVPVGVAGELYIGGEGLARGYINQPDRTAERFVPNPFAERYNDKALEHLNDLDDERSSARLYRTGDLVRYAPDGAIEYLGRLDHQVKLRGFRIELGEIEAALARHQQVQAVLVVVREDVPGDRHLVAYVVPSDEGRRAESPSDEAAGAADTDLVLRLPSLVSELRVWLKPLLPSYMIPAAFVVLERMPLTPNGKIDRRALPAPEQVRPDLEVAFVAPRTPTEQAIAQIWVEVLGIAQVGLHDSFFDLGGHSLLAMQVLTRLRETFQLDLSLSSLFEHPSVAELAELVVGQQIADSDEDTLAQLLAEIEQLDGDTVTDVAEAL